MMVATTNASDIYSKNTDSACRFAQWLHLLIWHNSALQLCNPLVMKMTTSGLRNLTRQLTWVADWVPAGMTLVEDDWDPPVPVKFLKKICQDGSTLLGSASHVRWSSSRNTLLVPSMKLSFSLESGTAFVSAAAWQRTLLSWNPRKAMAGATFHACTFGPLCNKLLAGEKGRGMGKEYHRACCNLFESRMWPPIVQCCRWSKRSLKTRLLFRIVRGARQEDILQAIEVWLEKIYLLQNPSETHKPLARFSVNLGRDRQNQSALLIRLGRSCEAPWPQWRNYFATVFGVRRTMMKTWRSLQL